MEIRQLRYFVSAIRRGSLKEAAREHFVTQPAVSIQLKKLADEVGEPLYVWRGKRILPTQTGSFLASRAEDIVARVDALGAAIRERKEGTTGFLGVGNIDAASIYVLPGVFRRFRRKYPRVDIRVVVADSEGLIAALESGSIEIAIVTLPLRDAGFEVIPIYEDRMVLVAAPKHELVAKGLSGLEALRAVADAGLITYPANSTTRRIIDDVFIDSGLTIRAPMEMSSPEAIKRLTESGLGAGILPLAIVRQELSRGTLHAVPTGRARFTRMLGVVYRDRQSLSPPATGFLTMLMEKRRKGKAR